jgi:ArsR family transcriptional regulator, virulence genes transcriptional regulator
MRVMTFKFIVCSSKGNSPGRAGKALMPTDIPRPIDPTALKTAERQMLAPRNEKRMRALLDALCDPARIKIVRALRDTTLAASDLANVIGRNRTATSQHLRVLREHGAIIAKRVGKIVRYTLSSDLSGTIIEEAASVFDQLQPGTAATT